jgi:hypothetical protein
MPRFGMALVLAVSLAALSASAVFAVPPQQYSGTFSYTNVVASVGCQFTVTVSGSASYTGREYFDQNGVATMAEERDTAQDTFTNTANGNKLVGEPYSWNAKFTFDSAGNTISWSQTGFAERVRLPDGHLFTLVGHFHPLPTHGWTWVPDEGHTGDIAAFCAALS